MAVRIRRTATRTATPSPDGDLGRGVASRGEFGRDGSLGNPAAPVSGDSFFYNRIRHDGHAVAFSPSVRVDRVVGIRPESEMVGVDAQLVHALVDDLEPVRDRPEEQLPAMAMGENLCAVDAEYPVALKTDVPGERPAFVTQTDVDGVPESLVPVAQSAALGELGNGIAGSFPVHVVPSAPFLVGGGVAAAGDGASLHGEDSSMAVRIRRTSSYFRKFGAIRNAPNTAMGRVLARRFRGLRRETPVDTGRLKRGWRLNQRKETTWSVFNRTPYTEIVNAVHPSRAGWIDFWMDERSIAREVQKETRSELRRTAR